MQVSTCFTLLLSLCSYLPISFANFHDSTTGCPPPPTISPELNIGQCRHKNVSEPDLEQLLWENEHAVRVGRHCLPTFSVHDLGLEAHRDEGHCDRTGYNTHRLNTRAACPWTRVTYKSSNAHHRIYPNRRIRSARCCDMISTDKWLNDRRGTCTPYTEISTLQLERTGCRQLTDNAYQWTYRAIHIKIVKNCVWEHFPQPSNN